MVVAVGGAGTYHVSRVKVGINLTALWQSSPWVHAADCVNPPPFLPETSEPGFLTRSGLSRREFV